MLELAYRKGALFDAWSEYFRYDLWMEAFEELNIDPEFYTLRQRPLDELLPWDFINAGVTKKFLQKEWKAANGRNSNAKLPYEMFRLWCRKIQRRGMR